MLDWENNILKFVIFSFNYNSNNAKTFFKKRNYRFFILNIFKCVLIKNKYSLLYCFVTKTVNYVFIKSFDLLQCLRSLYFKEKNIPISKCADTTEIQLQWWVKMTLFCENLTQANRAIDFNLIEQQSFMMYCGNISFLTSKNNETGKLYGLCSTI